MADQQADTSGDERIAREILELGRREPLTPEEAERLLRRIFGVMQARGTLEELPPPDWQPRR